MDKELFKDKNPLLRRQMLEDNCAAVERITYTSPFSEEEMGERKTELANIDLDMAARAVLSPALIPCIIMQLSFKEST